MAKAKPISLRQIVREIETVEKELKKAGKRAKPEVKKDIALAIKDLNKIKMQVKRKCVGVYIAVPVFVALARKKS